MGAMASYLRGTPGPSGFGSTSTAEDVTKGLDLHNYTAIVTGIYLNLFLQGSPPFHSTGCMDLSVWDNGSPLVATFSPLEQLLMA